MQYANYNIRWKHKVISVCKAKRTGYNAVYGYEIVNITSDDVEK